MTTTDAPIACTLGAGDFKARMAWLADLNARALAEYRRDGLTLHLKYRAEARDEVEDLVRKERECCGFLEFQVRQEGGFVDLAVTAPAGAEIAAQTLFNDFISNRATGCAPACGCVQEPS